ncbi:MAG: ABC transporter permease [Segetibacter sp.]
MLKNYLKLAFRNLVRNKIYSSINIGGLAIGLAVCMLIILYVGHEYSYDRFHKNADRICWIQGKIKMGNDSVNIPFMSYAAAPAVKETEPLVESFVRFKTDDKNTVIQNPQSPSLKFTEDKFVFADSNFFSFFPFHCNRVISDRHYNNHLLSSFLKQQQKNILGIKIR